MIDVDNAKGVMFLRKDKVILFTSLIVCIAVGLYVFLGGEPEAQPMPAAGMSVEDRTENDSAVIEKAIRKHGEVELVAIDYSGKVITVHSGRASTDQYAREHGEDIVKTVKETLEAKRRNLTLEADSYGVVVYGKDNSIIIMK